MGRLPSTRRRPDTWFSMPDGPSTVCITSTTPCARNGSAAADAHWVDVAVRSADVSWLLLAAAIRRHDPTRFLARVELLNGLRLVLDEAPELVRAESRLVFGALDDTEVTLRALRAALCIRGRHPNPAAAARIRQVLAVIAADLDATEPVRQPPHDHTITGARHHDRPSRSPRQLASAACHGRLRP